MIVAWSGRCRTRKHWHNAIRPVGNGMIGVLRFFGKRGRSFRTRFLFAYKPWVPTFHTVPYGTGPVVDLTLVRQRPDQATIIRSLRDNFAVSPIRRVAVSFRIAGPVHSRGQLVRRSLPACPT